MQRVKRMIYDCFLISFNARLSSIKQAFSSIIHIEFLFREAIEFAASNHVTAIVFNLISTKNYSGVLRVKETCKHKKALKSNRHNKKILKSCLFLSSTPR